LFIPLLSCYIMLRNYAPVSGGFSGAICWNSAWPSRRCAGTRHESLRPPRVLVAWRRWPRLGFVPRRLFTYLA
jgi:hypothetical protein